jgi:hypothetical protein
MLRHILCHVPSIAVPTDGPYSTLERSATDTLTLRFLPGPADTPRKSRKTWPPPTTHPARNADDILAQTRERRQGSGVVLVSPIERLTQWIPAQITK